jgi:multimeric flavodoxin WrbA
MFMKTKLVGFVGSPRKSGNTESLVAAILGGAKEKGAETKLVRLAERNISGCQGDYACRQTGRCVRKDDMQECYDDVMGANAVILGSPVYMWQMTAQTKLFVDRLLAFLNPDYSTRIKKGTKLVLVYTQGQPDTQMFMPYFQHTQKMFNFLGFECNDILVAGGTGAKDDILKQTDVLARAKELGKKLVG